MEKSKKYSKYKLTMKFYWCRIIFAFVSTIVERFYFEQAIDSTKGELLIEVN